MAPCRAKQVTARRGQAGPRGHERGAANRAGGLARGAGDPVLRGRGWERPPRAPRTRARSARSLRPPPSAARPGPARRCPGAAAPVPVAPLRSASTFPQQVESRQGARAGGGNGEAAAAALPPAESSGEIVSPKPNRRPESPRPGAAAGILPVWAPRPRPARRGRVRSSGLRWGDPALLSTVTTRLRESLRSGLWGQGRWPGGGDLRGGPACSESVT